MKMKVLALSPHTDDVEHNAGGTIAKLVEEGNDVTCIVFSPALSPEILALECKKALHVLGVEKLKIYEFPVRHFPEHRQEILQILYDYNVENNPDLVFTPSRCDIHQDHQVVSNETLRAFKVNTILGYSSYWNSLYQYENCFIALSEGQIQKKLESLRCYKSQITRHYFNEDALLSLLKSKGLCIKTRYAEAFEVIKIVNRLKGSKQT